MESITKMFSPWFWWMVLWLICIWPTDILTHLILAMTQLIRQPLSLYILPFHTMSHQSSLIVIHFYSYDSFSCAASSFFPWLCYCAYWGCTSWLIPDSFLTHIILHTGRIFWQWHHNRIVCLVIESALHVYKGQFSPWFGQLTIQTLLEFSYYGNTHTTKFVNLASCTVLSKRSTSRLGVSKTLRFGHNLTSSLRILLTFRFCQLQDKYKSSLLSTFLEYDYESIGSWNWEKCLGRLHHWHCVKQVPEHRTSISHTKLVELTPVSHIIMASILHFKVHTTYCLRLSMATST